MERSHREKYEQLGLNIAYYRRKRKMTQENLADDIGVSRTHISNIEATAMDKAMSLDLLFDIAKALAVTENDLFEVR